MVQHSITFTTGIAALGALLLIGAAPALSTPAPKDQSRIAAVPAEVSRPAVDATKARVVSLPFSACLEILADASKDASTKPVDLISTDDLRVSRIEAADGAVTISCDRQRGRMALTKSTAPAAPTVVAAR